MDYRNERDALRGRVEGLEQELEEARRELSMFTTSAPVAVDEALLDGGAR